SGMGGRVCVRMPEEGEAPPSGASIPGGATVGVRRSVTWGPATSKSDEAIEDAAAETWASSQRNSRGGTGGISCAYASQEVAFQISCSSFSSLHLGRPLVQQSSVSSVERLR